MAHRGLRKTPTRRSLRPRNHGSSSGSVPAVRASSIPAAASGRPSQRTAAVDTETGTHPVYSRREEREQDDVGSLPDSAGDCATPSAELAEASHSVREAAAAAHTPADAADHPAAVAHDDPLAHAFFERASDHEIHDDAYVIHHLSRGSRRAMFASLGIFVVSLVSIGSYAVYQNFVMPAPAELGASLADIPAVPQPEPQNVAPASSRWAAVDRAPRRVSIADADGTKPGAAGSETQLSAATDPVQFDVQGSSAKAQLRAAGDVANAQAFANGATVANGQPAANGAAVANEQAAPGGQRSLGPSPTASELAAANGQPGAHGHPGLNGQPGANGQPGVNAQSAANGSAATTAPAGAAPGASAQGATVAATRSATSQPSAPASLAASPGAAAQAAASPQATTALAAAAAETPKREPVQFASAAEPGHPSGGLPATANSGPTYDELVAVGRALSKKNRRVEASEAFRRALLQSPQGSAALSGLGYVYLNADEKQNAREYAQRAVQADASNAEGWIVLGAALEMMGDRAGARDAYRKCVERGQGPYLLECRRVAR